MEYGNEEHLDLRQRKTRKLLVEALAQLLEEKSFQELSVTDICRRAMVHRTTFYAHFNDKQELLRYLLEGLERECTATCLPQDPERSPREYLLTAAHNVFQFFAQHRTLYRACLNSGADTRVHTLEAVLPGNCAVAFRTPLSGSLPAGGSGSRCPLLRRSHALSHPLVALQRAPAASQSPSG